MRASQAPRLAPGATEAPSVPQKRSQRHSWRDEANCQGYGHLYDGEGMGPFSSTTRRALRRCAMCPVRAECLRWGLTDSFHLVIPIWDQVHERVDPVVHEHRTATSLSVFAGTLRSDREAVADLPLAEQEAVLAERFRERALGRAPLVTPSEWVESALPLEETG